MININLDKENAEVEIIGHGGNSNGIYDISCCVVSTIACTLAEAVAEYIIDFKEFKGYMYIKTTLNDKTKACFDMAEVGLKRAAVMYPDNIKIFEKI